MRTIKSLVIPALLLTLLSAPLSGLDNEFFPVYMEILSATESEPPELIGSHLLFRYDPGRPTRFVAAAFAHENFATMHYFERNSEGVFVLDLISTDLPSMLEYRIVQDGLWMADPTNPMSRLDAAGNRLSIIDLPVRPVVDPVSPIIAGDGTATFRYLTTLGRRVYLAGSFNNYNPFMYPMAPVANSPGEFELEIRLPPGDYRYYFVVDGVRRLDPRNRTRAIDPEGNEYSLITVGS